MYSACPHPTWKVWKSWAPSRWRPARRTKLIPHGQRTGRRMPDPHGGHIGYYVLCILNLPDIWPPISDKYPNWCVGQVPSSRRGAMHEHGTPQFPQQHTTTQTHDRTPQFLQQHTTTKLTKGLHSSCNNTLPHKLTAEAHDHHRGSPLARVKHSSQGCGALGHSRHPWGDCAPRLPSVTLLLSAPSHELPSKYAALVRAWGHATGHPTFEFPNHEPK